MGKLKALVVDIETAPALVATFSLYPKSLPYQGIVQDWFIICAAWKELGSDKVNSVAIKEVGDDYEVVKRLRDNLAEADVIIGHNFKKFDIKKITARLMYHGIEPLPPIPIIDTLSETKKVSNHISHRLDYLAKTLCNGGKMQTSPNLWMDVLAGKRSAVKEMVEYNKKDVIENEKYYERVKPYLKMPVHIGAMMGHFRNLSCPKCGSDKFVVRHDKRRYTVTGLERLERQCASCGGYHTFKLER